MGRRFQRKGRSVSRVGKLWCLRAALGRRLGHLGRTLSVVVGFVLVRGPFVGERMRGQVNRCSLGDRAMLVVGRGWRLTQHVVVPWAERGLALDDDLLAGGIDWRAMGDGSLGTVGLRRRLLHSGLHLVWHLGTQFGCVGLFHRRRRQRDRVLLHLTASSDDGRGLIRWTALVQSDRRSSGDGGNVAGG